MKPQPINQPAAAERAGRNLSQACATSCQKVLAQLNRTKAAIFAESFHALRAPKRLLQLALNEAEALALQTGYPHLVFPVLAREKVQAAANWSRKQQSVRPGGVVLRLAA